MLIYYEENISIDDNFHDEYERQIDHKNKINLLSNDVENLLIRAAFNI